MSLRETPKTTHPSLQNQLHSKTTHRFTPNWSMVSMCFWVRFLDKCERKQTAFPSGMIFQITESIFGATRGTDDKQHISGCKFFVLAKHPSYYPPFLVLGQVYGSRLICRVNPKLTCSLVYPTVIRYGEQESSTRRLAFHSKGSIPVMLGCLHPTQVLLPSKKQQVFPEQVWFFQKVVFFGSVYIYVCICVRVCVLNMYIYIMYIYILFYYVYIL
jgi:hypothetical protein